MPTYRYINANHTLAYRDDYVIEWNPNANAPASNDELKTWRDAGSPQPASLVQTELVTTQELTMMPGPGWSSPPSGELVPAIEQFEGLEKALPRANDLAALKAQVEVLTEIVGKLTGLKHGKRQP